MGRVDDLHLLTYIIEYLQNIFLCPGMQTQPWLIDEKNPWLIIVFNGIGFQFKIKGKKPSYSAATLFGVQPFPVILYPELNKRLKSTDLKMPRSIGSRTS